MPDWIREIDDSCLKAVVVEALIARLSAIDNGAEDHEACNSALRSGDATMDSIRFGRVKGEEACKKAATAVRKYNTASECVVPTATAKRRR